jgi:CBS domain-containing protein
MMKVANILKTKGHNVLTVLPSETIAQLAKRLRLERVGAMIVSRDGSIIDGIISERDVAYGFAEHQGGLAVILVADLMTKSVVTCSPDDNVSDIAKIMTQRRIRHLPIQGNGKLVGIISVGDVVKHRLDELQLETNVLRDYAIAAR